MSLARNTVRSLPVHARESSAGFGGVWTRLAASGRLADASASTPSTGLASHAQPLADSRPNFRSRVLAALAIGAVALPLAACGREEPDLSNGKALFTQECGSCHVLGRAGTQGQTGPDLDTAFRTALADGMTRDTVEGIVDKQIRHPRESSAMPAGLVKGDDARDVAAYVAFAAGRPGEDKGALAQAGLAGATSGEQIFTAAGCAGCHKLSKAGATGTIGPDLDELAQMAEEQGGSPEEFVRRSILDPNADVAQGFQQGVMPSFEGRLDDKQVQALVQYLLGD